MLGPHPSVSFPFPKAIFLVRQSLFQWIEQMLTQTALAKTTELIVTVFDEKCCEIEHFAASFRGAWEELDRSFAYKLLSLLTEM